MLVAILIILALDLMFNIAVLSQVASMNQYIAASYNIEYHDEIKAVQEMQEANEVSVADKG